MRMLNEMKLKTQFQKGKMEAGCDEAGRGCLAGSVFAAAVILPEKFYHPSINDSKKLKKADRNDLRKLIEDKALHFSVAKVEEGEIDTINILNASILAMHKALDGMGTEPEFIVVDGNRFKKYKNIEHLCVIGGDAKYLNIAAASILAKTYRDEYMDELHELHPEYGWNKNKAYATAFHREAIRKYGLTKFHRKSFTGAFQQYSLPF